MAFSDNAIGFYLEIENSNFSDTLASAEKDYDRFVKALDKHNKMAFESATRGLGRIEDLFEAAAELPERAALATRRASAKIAKELKPLALKVDLQFSSRAKGTLKRAMREAVGEALTGAKIRLGASTPAKRLGMFDDSLSLRALYAGIPQPPDMVGRIQPRKFREGGIVEGPDKGFDSVLSLLQPGEMVLPKDVSDQLQELAGAALEGVGGEFIDPADLAKAFAEVENMARGLEKLKGVIDAGFGTESDIAMLNKGMAQLTKGTIALDDTYNDLAFTTKVRLAPAIEQVHNRMGELQDKTNGVAAPAERLLQGIMGPARFLAINKAATQLGETVKGLASGTSTAFTTLGGAEVGSAVDNINQMNQFLGVSRDRLREIKGRAAEMADEIDGVSINEFTASLRDAAELGIRNEENLFRIAKASSLAAVGLGVASSNANELGFELTSSIGLSQEAFEGVLATMGTLSDETSGFNISASKLFEQTRADVTALGSSLRELSEEDAETLIGSFNRMGAVLASQFIDSAPEIRQTLAKAFEGGPENIEAMQQAALLTGMGIDELRARLKEGDIEGVFDGIANATQGMGTEQLNAFARQVGVASTDLAKFRESGDAFNEGLARSETLVTANADALGVLEERAQNNKSAFEKLQEGFVDTISNMSVLGVQGVEVLDFFKEFNAGTLLSIGFLAKWGLQAVAAGGKFLGLGGILGKVGGMMGGGKKGVVGGIGGITGAAGKAGGGGVIASLFTGLSTGLTTLAGGLTTFGTAMLGPGGLGLAAGVLAILALAGAARLAAPALEIVGEVAMKFIDGIVDVAKAFLSLDPKRMLAAGPGLIATGAGFSVLGVGLAASGAGAASAAVGFGALAAVTAIAGGARGKGISGIVGMLLADLEPLAGMAPRLKGVINSLDMVVDFLVQFAKVSGALTVLGGVAMFQNLVGGFLDLIGIGSPMEHLAVRSEGVANTVETMLDNFARLATFTPESLSGITGTLRTMIGFMGDYARLSEAIDELPGGGIFGNIGDAIGGLFGADSPAEKLAEASGPIVDAMSRLLSRFSELQGFVQPRQATAVSPEAIQAVVQATLERDTGDQLGDKLDEQTRLMAMMLETLRAQLNVSKPRPEPSTRVVQGPSQGGGFTRGAASGDY